MTQSGSIHSEFNMQDLILYRLLDEKQASKGKNFRAIFITVSKYGKVI